MNIDKVTKLFEIAGVIVVVTSLFFIYEELKLTKQTIRSGSNLQLLSLSFQIREDVANNQELASLLEKANSTDDSLSSAERRRYFAHISRTFDVWEQAYFSQRDSFIHSGLWQAWDCSYRKLFSRPGPIRFWKEQKSMYSYRFREYVDNIISGKSDDSHCM